MKTISFSCDQCLVQTVACDECVVPLLCDTVGPVVLTAREQRALQVLAGEALVPPLRLVRSAEVGDATQPVQLAG